MYKCSLIIQRLRKYILPLFISITLSACATMSGDECEVADWQIIGYEDGQSGRTLSFKNERAKDCAKHGIGINHRVYDAARSRGLAQYCVYETAYNLGKRGQRYNGVCVDHDEPSFLLAHRQGSKHGEFIRSLNQVNSKIKKAEKELDSLNNAFDKLKRGGEKEPPLSVEEAFDQAIVNMQRQLYIEEIYLPHWYERKDIAAGQLQEFEARFSSGDPAAMEMQAFHFEPAEEQAENFDYLHAVMAVAAQFYGASRSPSERYVLQACKLYEYAGKELQNIPEWNLYEGTSDIHDQLLYIVSRLKQRREFSEIFRDSFREDAIAIKVSRACPDAFNAYRRTIQQRLY